MERSVQRYRMNSKMRGSSGIFCLDFYSSKSRISYPNTVKTIVFININFMSYNKYKFDISFLQR